MPVLAEKSRLSAPGKKTEAVDSLYREQFMATHLGELLGTASGMFVKSYGPGLSVTTAMRGGNASQTAVLWNGLSIQNPMLAQSDLSNLPVLFFEQAEVEYGGSSAMWGSGAIGGSVRIGSLPPVNKGLRIKLMCSAGSFGRMLRAGMRTSSCGTSHESV